MIFFFVSMLSLPCVFLFVLMPEVPLLQYGQRILISVTLSPGAFACTTITIRSSPHGIAASASGLIPASWPARIT